MLMWSEAYTQGIFVPVAIPELEVLTTDSVLGEEPLGAGAVLVGLAAEVGTAAVVLPGVAVDVVFVPVDVAFVVFGFLAVLAVFLCAFADATVAFRAVRP